MRQFRCPSIGGLRVFPGLVVLAWLALLPSARPAAQAARTARPTAASADAPTFERLVIVSVKPESWDDYVTMEKTETIPALRQAGVERRRAWRTSELGRAYEVAYLYPFKSFASFDEPGPFVRALGTEGAKAHNARMSILVAATRVLAIRTRTDLSYGLGREPSKLGVVAHVLAQPSRLLEFEALLKTEWGPALRKGGVPLYVVHEVTMGGEMGEYYTFTPIEQIAALDAGHPILKSLGNAGYRALLGRIGATVRSVERQVMRLDEELSFDAPAAGK